MNICWWSVGDKKHAKYLQAAVWSARNNANITDPIHVWSDVEIEGATTHKVGSFDKSHYLFKFQFLRNEVKKLDYEWFAFFDADSWFVRKPLNIENVLNGDPIHVCLESRILPESPRKDWWGIPNQDYINIMREKGVRSENIYNTNAGFFIIHRDIIDQALNMAMEFWGACQKRGWKQTTEEPPLAYIGHMLVGSVEKHTLNNWSWLWGSDWTGKWTDKFPDQPWGFTDYMSNHEYINKINPAIVHMMRGKELLFKKAESLNNKPILTNLPLTTTFPISSNTFKASDLYINGENNKFILNTTQPTYEIKEIEDIHKELELEDNLREILVKGIIDWALANHTHPATALLKTDIQSVMKHIRS